MMHSVNNSSGNAGRKVVLSVYTHTHKFVELLI